VLVGGRHAFGLTQPRHQAEPVGQAEKHRRRTAENAIRSGHRRDPDPGSRCRAAEARGASGERVAEPAGKRLHGHSG
jgi:hypothetical protein